MMKFDRLSALIERFRVATRIAVGVDASATAGANLFVLRRGRLRLTDGADETLFAAPTLIFFARGMQEKSRVTSDGTDVEFVAANVEAGGDSNPIAAALPPRVVVDLGRVPALAAVVDILVEEVVRPRCGGGAVLDRLCEVVVIRLLRHLIETGAARVGMLAGLAHPQLARAIVAMHENPARPWHLEDLAAVAGMSRTRFATTFRDVVGETPGEYLSNWRLALARTGMAKGLPAKAVARSVGFTSPAAFSRAYSRRFGHSPRQAANQGG